MVITFLMDKIGRLLVEHKIRFYKLSKSRRRINGIDIIARTCLNNPFLHDAIGIVQGIDFAYRDLYGASVLLDIDDAGLFLQSRSGNHSDGINMRQSVCCDLPQHLESVEIHGRYSLCALGIHLGVISVVRYDTRTGILQFTLILFLRLEYRKIKLRYQGLVLPWSTLLIIITES